MKSNFRKMKLSPKARYQRPVATDILPFEVPPSFSNSGFFAFLTQLQVTIGCWEQKKTVRWVASDDRFDDAFRIIFRLADKTNKNFRTIEQAHNGKNLLIREWKICLNWTIPFNFRISHKEAEFRQLSVIHPQAQMFIAEFYHLHASEILYHCSKSSFSIRFPSSVARSVRYKDRLFKENIGDPDDSIEEAGKEYEGSGSYFIYSKYSNIFKFYENYAYLNAERKFGRLYKLDISSCFDSIYTHSIEWATLGKEIAKEKLGNTSSTFGSRFDKLIQELNRGETSGIVIGPEFSRVFAEIILQDIDRKLEEILIVEHGLANKVDYELFRYVDDYFVFCDSDEVAGYVRRHLSGLLKLVKLTLSSEKSELYERPIITPLTVAKNKISNCLAERIVTDTKKRGNPDGGDDVDYFNVKVQARSLIVDYKTALKESGVKYKDVLNYTLAAIERKVNIIFRKFKSNHDDHKDYSELVSAMLGILEFSTFVYAAQPRINFAVRLTRIISTVIDKLHEVNAGRDLKDRLFKFIFDTINRHVKHTPHDRFHEVETLYLLLALNKLGRGYRIPEQNIATFVGLEISDAGDYSFKKYMSYFSISVCLLYIRNQSRYGKLRNYLEVEIRKKFEDRKHYLHQDAELVIAALDLQSCPYVSQGLKEYIASLYGIETTRHPLLQRATPYWFTNWRNFDLSRELDKKRAREVY
ncbi:antiviral reverse transcriptase Drt3b [Asaia platycodi]|uniref:antiviral reverse transcriptase Drt3b n=1 Tax=Asaia platycodi TaxID=610243 RepID=UPI000688721E|nr:antiviral reverse transcriptase Drt3b [Asaia platycodi]